MCISADRPLGQCYLCKLYATCESKVVNEEFDADSERLSENRAKFLAEVEAFKKKWRIEP
jgi:hypothetical protein